LNLTNSHDNMSFTPEQESSHSNNQALFENLENYPWSSDEEFQAGLRAILDTDTGRQNTEALTVQARCFYYSR
jgi:Tfp pilus assembly protein FimT